MMQQYLTGLYSDVGCQAYIYATENSYGSNDWQKCLVTPNIGNLHLDDNKYCTSASNFAGQAYLSLLVALVGAHVGLVDNALLPVSIYTSIVSYCPFIFVTHVDAPLRRQE